MQARKWKGCGRCAVCVGRILRRWLHLLSVAFQHCMHSGSPVGKCIEILFTGGTGPSPPPLLMCCGTEKTNFIRCCSSSEQLPRLSPALRPAATPYPAFLDPGHAKDLSRISDFNDGVDADAGSGERKTWRLPPEPATRPTCQVLQPSAMQLQATGNITKTE
jgi:hypothetical protein